MTERRKSNLGKILKGITEKEPETTSIAAAINDACSKGLTAEGSFSVIGIRKKVVALNDVLLKDEFNRDDFFRTFNELYSMVMAPDKRAKSVFHPSQLLDGCSRMMAFELMGTEASPVKHPITGELQRIFDVGTWYHVYIQNILYKIGLLEQAEVPVVNKVKRLNGKADGLFKKEVFGEKVVLEIKTMNHWNFQKATFRPFKKHEFQASLYARELGAKKVLYLYIDKDTSEIREFLMPLNEEQLAIADKKMDSILSCVNEGVLPPRTCGDKFCDNALTCPYVNKCFK